MTNKIKNFDIQNKLGSGSYGVIYKVINKQTRQVCVLKQISLGRLSDKAKKNAINEATIMGKLVHPFIVRYKESFIQDKILNIVMEYCDNGDLNQFLKTQNKRPLKEEKIWRFFLEITIGLEYIHKNRILHRDIKTLNIFMNKNQELKIGDLGVAKILSSNQFAQTMVGTPFYLSPELCEEKPYNQKSDIWALGCLLYELCTYKHPFEAQNQGSLILKIVRGKYTPIPEFYSKDLRQIIDLCLERDYKRRPTTSNLLSRPKIKEIIQKLGLNKLVEDEMKKISLENNISPKVNIMIDKQVIVPKQNVVKAIDGDLAKKGLQQKMEVRKQQNKKIYIIKKDQKKEDKKREPVIILPKPMSERKIQISNKINQGIPCNQDKKIIISNLQKNLGQKIRVIPKQIQENKNKKEERIQNIAQKVQQIKKDHKNSQFAKNSSFVEKRSTPSLSDKKPNLSNEAVNKVGNPNQVFNKGNIPMPNRPPAPPSAQNKEKITKVKNEKVVQAKVYDSQRNILKPTGIIKSGGFSTHIQPERNSNQKVEVNSKQKIISAKRSSQPCIKIDKQRQAQKQHNKQLFGVEVLATPYLPNKSEKNIIKPVSSSIFDSKKKEEVSNISRVRRWVKNEMARNARNVSNINQISKQEEDLVMNLPSNINKTGIDSSDSQDEISKQKNIADLRRRSNHNKFNLKQINHDLVLQKYEDLMNNQYYQSKEESIDSSSKSQEEAKEEQKEEVQEQQIEEVNSRIQKAIDVKKEQEQEKIVEDIFRKNSSNSNQQIEQEFEVEANNYEESNIMDFANEKNQQEKNPDEVCKEEWSFDQEPELPMLQQKQSPYFQPDNPYLVEEQEETTEDKINYLQIKLQQNMKREDQINKLMNIKIQQCRKFVGTEKSLQQILQFFRNKLHMEDDYSENDEKQVEVFLKKKGLTDHYKFQNIYKIMHFEMELDNTRKIIQRICKKLSDLEVES